MILQLSDNPATHSQGRQGVFQQLARRIRWELAHRFAFRCSSITGQCIDASQSFSGGEKILVDGGGSCTVSGDAPGIANAHCVHAPADLRAWSTLADLDHCCQALLARRTARLVIDLSSVEHADTKLVACLLGLLRTARRTRAALHIRPSQPVEELAAMCRVHNLLLNSSAGESCGIPGRTSPSSKRGAMAPATSS